MGPGSSPSCFCPVISSVWSRPVVASSGTSSPQGLCTTSPAGVGGLLASGGTSSTSSAYPRPPALRAGSNRMFQSPQCVPHAVGFWRTPAHIKGLRRRGVARLRRHLVRLPAPTSPQSGIKSLFSIASICTTRRRIPASARTNEGLRRRGVARLRGAHRPPSKEEGITGMREHHRGTSLIRNNPN